MALQELLNIGKNEVVKIGISEERIRSVIEPLRQYIAFWREYPDLFVDFLQTGGDPTKKKDLNLFFYQRIFLRVAARYRYVYAVYPRAFSKSFLAVLTLMIRCILYPGCKLFSAAGGKEQAAGILKEKVQELCRLVPALEKELDMRPGKTKDGGKDYVIYVFKNGSYFDNVAARERSRGKRRHAGVLEECVGIDGDILQEVLIPMMNVRRRCLDGTTQKDETLNQSQLYITTSGYKGTFAYTKLIQTLVQMIIEPDRAFILGGTWRLPVLFDMLDKDFVNDLRRDPTFNQASFEREYESKWSGTSDGAFFDGAAFDRSRVLQKCEMEHSGRAVLNAYYLISVDVGRKGCDSVAEVFRVMPQNIGASFKSLVNIFTYSDEHFGDQALKLKKLFYRYKAKRIVIDANGLGIGLIDFMVKQQIDSETGEVYPDFGVYNDPDKYYAPFRTDITELNAMYLIKANAAINTEAHANLQVQLSSGKLRFLIEERMAQSKLLATKVGQMMTPEARDDYLRPYKLTSILKDELLNLREENEGINIILKQANRSISKDKVSSLEYGLYYIREEEENKKRKKKFNVKDFMFMN